MPTVVLTQPKPSRRRQVVGLSWVAIWLVFLGSPIAHITRQNSGLGELIGVSAVVVFAVCYLLLFVTARLPARRGECRPSQTKITVLLCALVLCTLIALPFAEESTLTMLVYLGAAAMFTFEPRVGVVVVAGLALLAEVSSRLISGWQDQQWSASLAILFAGAAVNATRLAFRRNEDLMAAREEMAQLAIAEERSRMTRDLHDILGHSLTVITVKAQLAGRLVATDESRAAAEIADIERLAREALTDVRATIAGKREVNLAPELVNARAALLSANIDAEVPYALDEVPTANRELFGWTVREGVTNVLRHSKASRCVISLRAGSVEVHDDGVGAAPEDLDGNGLRGLRERVSAAGGSIETGPSEPLGGFLLRVVASGATGE